MIEDMSCIFCAIVAGDIPATVVHETDSMLAFRDLHPVAPVHVLVIPKKHYANVLELSEDAQAAAQMLTAVADVVAAEDLGDGCRLVFNTGPAGGQEVDHVHAHVIGGRQMTWPPG